MTGYQEHLTDVVQVLLLTIVATSGLLLICARRWLKIFGSAELGGPTVPKYISATILILLWVAFIVISSLRAYGIVKSPFL